VLSVNKSINQLSTPTIKNISQTPNQSTNNPINQQTNQSIINKLNNHQQSPAIFQQTIALSHNQSHGSIIHIISYKRSTQIEQRIRSKSD
jgi:hypothetical protein